MRRRKYDTDCSWRPLGRRRSVVVYLLDAESPEALSRSATHGRNWNMEGWNGLKFTLNVLEKDSV